MTRLPLKYLSSMEIQSLNFKRNYHKKPQGATPLRIQRVYTMAENLNLQSLFYLGSWGGKTSARCLPLSSLSQLLMAPNCFLRKIPEKILQNQIDAISFQAKVRDQRTHLINCPHMKSYWPPFNLIYCYIKYLSQDPYILTLEDSKQNKKYF